MAKKRTKSLQAMVDKANAFLANSDDSLQRERRATQHFVEGLLMEAKSYRGFNYLYWLSQGCNEWRLAGEPDSEHDRYIYGPSGDSSRTIIY